MSAVPDADQLQAIDDVFDQRTQERDALLEQLPSLNARSISDVALKLSVAVRILDPVDHPAAHALIKSCDRDLTVIEQALHSP